MKITETFQRIRSGEIYDAEPIDFDSEIEAGIYVLSLMNNWSTYEPRILRTLSIRIEP